MHTRNKKHHKLREKMDVKVTQQSKTAPCGPQVGGALELVRILELEAILVHAET